MHLFDPPTQWPRYCAKPRCIGCGGTDGVESIGWPKDKKHGGLLPMFKPGGIDWVYGRMYKHNGCKKPRTAGAKSTSWNTLNPIFLAQLDEFTLSQFPGYRTKNQVRA